MPEVDNATSMIEDEDVTDNVADFRRVQLLLPELASTSPQATANARQFDPLFRPFDHLASQAGSLTDSESTTITFGYNDAHYKSTKSDTPKRSCKLTVYNPTVLVYSMQNKRWGENVKATSEL